MSELEVPPTVALCPECGADENTIGFWVNTTFEVEQYGTRGMYFYEPLETTAPTDAQPYCCYIRTVIFYKQPYKVGPNGCFEEWDRIETQWDLLGRRWTHKIDGWAALKPFVQHAGALYELGGGRVLLRNGRWYMQYLGWRIPTAELERLRLCQTCLGNTPPSSTVCDTSDSPARYGELLC